MEAEQILVSRSGEISTHLINNVFNKSDINQAVIWIVNDLSKRYRRCSCDPVVIQKTLELWLEYVDSDRRYSYSQEIWSNEFTQLKGRNGYVFVMTGYQPGYYFVADSEDIYVVQLSKSDCKSHQRAIRAIIDKYNNKEYKTTKQLGIYDENLIVHNKIINLRKLREYITVEESGLSDLKPTNKNELKKLIDQRIKEQGPKCDLNDIDVSKVTDMSDLFRESPFNGDISQWDVSNVKDMRYMFNRSMFDGDISEWDVSNVRDMSYMFMQSQFDGDLSKWDVSNVIVMSNMFNNSKFIGDISKWDVSNVKDMSSMFYGTDFSRDISKWNTSSVRNMKFMFGCSGFYGDLSKWDVSNVEDMCSMFWRSSFNKDISKWDVSKVERMDYMFAQSKFNKDLSDWDVSNVENMDSMFYKSKFSGDISKWDVSRVKSMYNMFENSPLDGKEPSWYKE